MTFRLDDAPQEQLLSTLLKVRALRWNHPGRGANQRWSRHSQIVCHLCKTFLRTMRRRHPSTAVQTPTMAMVKASETGWRVKSVNVSRMFLDENCD
jgi:hypothetical protein